MHTRCCGRMAGCVALRRGPIIYTFEGVDNGEDLQTLRIPREAKIEALPYQADLLEGIVALRVTGCRKKAAVNPALMQKMRHRKTW